MLYDCFCKTSKQLKKNERKGIVGLFVSMSNVASELFLMVCDSLSHVTVEIVLLVVTDTVLSGFCLFVLLHQRNYSQFLSLFL